METKKNMICDIDTGICGPAGEGTTQFIDLSAPQKKVKITDADSSKDYIAVQQEVASEEVKRTENKSDY
ncbi:hypothetical protein FITA111629_06420 [Filibacter tadaridae]|uniref:Uncharacterized protein n=1 Tax=Filibacter tadaridae TaxID=2483811 RepID=A0A3P5XZ76_9BACL|nr:hypothetical protein [Filibacter tadaridae]VDC33507.1 hypothetical protein FILTAD_02917 [Filibacter tadaridae]